MREAIYDLYKEYWDPVREASLVAAYSLRYSTPCEHIHLALSLLRRITNTPADKLARMLKSVRLIPLI